MNIKSSFLLLFIGISFVTFAQKDIQKKIQSQLILAEDGAIIELPAGTFYFTNTLSLEGKKNIQIKGKGMDKTILSFKDQTDGAEGIRVSDGADILLDGFTVQDAKGDAIKTMHVKGITFKSVKTEWTGEPGPKNGGYGLYPVQCEGVTIDKCVAIGASDAGIYVGQSKEIVVKNSKAYHNVAGIEIENSLNADVFGNEAYDNAGGLLVFDLPNLVQKKGGNVKVHHNNIHNNNFPNFAPKGNIVAMVPTGTGLMILATKNVEIFKNKIINNQSVGTAIISYYSTSKPFKDKQYDPYPSAISIHNNIYKRKTGLPVSKDMLSSVVAKSFGENVPHIIYDGVKNPKLLDAQGGWTPGQCISIVKNKNQSIANLDVEHGFKSIGLFNDSFNCTQ